jgi:tetratricopeptide (TPR) repeat protein
VITAQQVNVRDLVPGAPIEQKISGGQIHTYQISLDANQYLRIEITTRDTALKLEMLGPDGSKAAGACNFVDAPGLSVMSLVATVSGLHRLGIRPPKETQTPTTYQVRIQALRSVTEDDKIRIAAETAESKAVTDTNGEEWQLTLAPAEEALRLWRKLDDRKAVLRMLVRLGAQYLNTGDTSKALIYYREALPLAQSLNDRYREGTTLLGLGNAFHRQNEAQEALEMFGKAKQIFASISRPDREAAVVSNMALVYLVMGDSNEAIKSLQQVVQTYATLKLPRYECNVLTSLGAAYAKISQRDKAPESFNRALTLAREHHLTGCEGRILRHMGYLYLSLNQKQKATEFFNQGLQLCRSVGDRLCEANCSKRIRHDQQVLRRL